MQTWLFIIKWYGKPETLAQTPWKAQKSCFFPVDPKKARKAEVLIPLMT